MAKTIHNPFVVGRYVSDRYFCDRSEETAFLIKQIENGRNVAIISPRRMGKTGLIMHCLNQKEITNRYIPIFVDIYATTSLPEFVYQLGNAVYEKLAPKSDIWKQKFFNIVASLRMGFKLDPMTGEPGFDIGLGDIKTPQTTLNEIFKYLEEADNPCILAIDEFQQIGNYEEKNTEAMLRTLVQRSTNTSFIFSGSKRHLMANMFNSPSKPFYQSCMTMGLNPIPLSTYTNFAVNLFEDYGKHLDRELVSTVYNMYKGCTWFVQMIMNELFSLTPASATCTPAFLPEAVTNVIRSQEQTYKELLSQMPPRQKMLLQAIARDGEARSITSHGFITRHSLPSASSVQSAAKGLLASDVITRDDDTYRIYDYFLSQWLATMY